MFEGPRVEFNDENLEAFAAGELHGGDHVGVAGKENDAVHDLFEGEGGDIDADPHVHALLFKVGVHVLGAGRTRRGAGHKGLAVGAAELPAAGFEFAAAQGHETCLAEVEEKPFSSRIGWHRLVVDLGAVHRVGHFAVERLAIVVEDAEEFFVLLENDCGVVYNLGGAGPTVGKAENLAQAFAEPATINEERRLFHKGGAHRPLRACGQLFCQPTGVADLKP